MPNHTGRLVLTTADPQADPAPALVAAALSEAGFIGPRLSLPGLAFSVGPRFLSLLAFTGCAVAIVSAPSGTGGVPYCHVRISELEPVPRLLCGRNTRPPRCPACRARLGDWKMRLDAWAERPQMGLGCPACGASRPPWRWDWKEQAGFGRRFVLVEEVFPGEAVPTRALLDCLTGACESGWRHFYVQD
jgi:hypothetical protein